VQTNPQTRRLLVPDIAWIEIPAGPFIYGKGDKPTTLNLDDFWMAKYPITNQQFQTFIDDGGYQDERWWRDLKKPEPQASNWPQANRPRTNVDWYEAVAFTRWLSAVLGLEENAIHLPTEQEWEKAARGEHGLIYPWGNEYKSGFANIDEKSENVGQWNLQQTTAVGLYPHGKSPYQAEDMAGTVLEWCLNKCEKPEVTEADISGDSRVLRGGSWLLGRYYARAVDRRRNDPVYRDVIRGFRVLSSVPIHAVR
jgi:formylglycine-generating enzyme required for sulfatase activity